MKSPFLEWLQQVKERALAALYSDEYLLERLALKGGTAIDISVEGGLLRSSLDLDFSIEGTFEKPLAELQIRVEKALNRQFRSLGYHVFDVKLGERPKPRDQPSWPEFWGGYRCEFRLARIEVAEQFAGSELRRRSEVLGERHRRAFKIDISKHEHVGDAVRAHELRDGTTASGSWLRRSCGRSASSYRSIPTAIVRRGRATISTSCGC